MYYITAISAYDGINFHNKYGLFCIAKQDLTIMNKFYMTSVLHKQKHKDGIYDAHKNC